MNILERLAYERREHRNEARRQADALVKDIAMTLDNKSGKELAISTLGMVISELQALQKALMDGERPRGEGSR